MCAGKVRTEFDRLLQNRSRALNIAFLYRSAPDVYPTVGVLGIDLSDLLKSCLGPLEIALEQETDAVVVPALPVVGPQLRLCLKRRRAARSDVQSDFVFGDGHDGNIGN